MAKQTIRIVDTTLRDGQASVWASRMRVGAMTPLLPDLDAAGYDSVELVAPNSQFVRWAKDLDENPWDWVEEAIKGAPHTQFRLHGGGGGGTSQAPPIIGDLIHKRFSDLGVSLTRTGNQWHNADQVARSCEKLKKTGFRPIVNLVYSISPYHTIDFYRTYLRRVKEMEPFRVCLKDVGGLLTPDTAQDLTRLMAEELPGIDLEFHAHCGGGMAPYCALIAAENGFTHIHTGIPPLANGGAQPSVFSVTDNLRARGYTVEIDTGPLKRVSRHLYAVAEAEDLPLGEPVEYKEEHFKYQLAGGAASHLHFQLVQLHLEHLWGDVLEEMVRVRADLGYPIMITPYVSWIGSQAMLNVASGSRYEIVSDEIIRYCYGYEGNADGVTHMDREVRAKILNSARATELQDWVRWNPTLEELEELYQTKNVDEIILRAYVGDKAIEVMARERNYPRSYMAYTIYSGSIAQIVVTLAREGEVGRLSFRRGRTTVALQQRREPTRVE
jgi:oxaloacetate decarboxylase alpha subunit